MRISFKINLPVAYRLENRAMEISVYGSILGDSSKIEVIANSDNPKWSDIDGDYFLIHKDLKNKKVSLIRGGYETFPIYVTLIENLITISDDLFWLAKLRKALTWNHVAISDYFSAGWNNSQKGDRTVFNEISKLEAGHYYTVDSSNEYKLVKNRLKINIKPKKYTYDINNLDEFKKEFLFLLDESIREISGDKISFSVSGGIDSSALAVTASSVLTDKKLNFFTISYGGKEDESSLASRLNSFLSSDVNIIKIEKPKNFLSHLKTLITITQSPYSDIEGLTHLSYFRKIKQYGCDSLVLGFGADLTFGGTPYEYPALAQDLLFSGKLSDAYRVYMAYLSGSGLELNPILNTTRFVKFIVMSLTKKLLPYSTQIFLKKITSSKNQNDDNSFIKIQLKKGIKKNIRYEDALSLAYGDSALRQLSQILRNQEIKPIYPFEGSKFSNLASKCDPLIFARYVNKFCLRYALREKIPFEILENKKKFGNGGYEFDLLELNKNEILKYINELMKAGKNTIVDLPLLEKAINASKFSDNTFRALNILVFEDIIHELGVTLSTREN